MWQMWQMWQMWKCGKCWQYERMDLEITPHDCFWILITKDASLLPKSKMKIQEDHRAGNKINQWPPASFEMGGG
jgi:hypothetical protein